MLRFSTESKAQDHETIGFWDAVVGDGGAEWAGSELSLGLRDNNKGSLPQAFFPALWERDGVTVVQAKGLGDGCGRVPRRVLVGPSTTAGEAGREARRMGDETGYGCTRVRSTNGTGDFGGGWNCRWL
jgi:hypothetical protein